MSHFLGISRELAEIAAQAPAEMSPGEVEDRALVACVHNAAERAAK